MFYVCMSLALVFVVFAFMLLSASEEESVQP